MRKKTIASRYCRFASRYCRIAGVAVAVADMRSLLSFTHMLVLGLDTTTRAGSCALTREGVVLREQASDAARPQASRLPGELMAVLDLERTEQRHQLAPEAGGR